ncbi:MAG: ATP synthase F0 subunit B, partial [Thermodesulfobacteriota bacterium]
MSGVKRIAGKSVLVAASLWLTLALGNVWAAGGHDAPAEPAADHAAAATHVDSHQAADSHGADPHAADTHAAADEHGEAVHHGDSLSPEKLKDLFWRVVNFAALMIILVKFGAKPIAGGLSGRRRQIQEEIEELESKKDDAERSYEEFSAKLVTVEKDIDGVVEKAIAQAEIEKTKIIERAEKAADDIKRQAEMAVANEITAAKRN